MSDQPTTPPNEDPQKKPNWLEEFQELANQVLGDDVDGSGCEQIHPIMARWYAKTMQGDPPESRASVWQAVSCLATEILFDMESDEDLDGMAEHLDEEALGMWIEDIIMIGRAFEIALHNGELDDL